MSQSNSEHLPFDPNDPRLTAYVLDELDAHDRAEIDRLIAESADARAAVEEIRETVAALQAAFDAEPIAPLEPLVPGDAAVIR